MILQTIISNKKMRINMKTLIIINTIFCLCLSNISAQSIVDIDNGSSIDIGLQAEVCSDIQTGDGLITGEGNWCDGVLPVELITFLSEVNEYNVTLRWITSHEINNSGFEIHRAVSDNNLQWIQAGFVHGSGNSNFQNNYNFIDKNLSAGKYLYRLKQIDFNGVFEYFELDNVIEIGEPEKFVLKQNYPNPFNPSTIISYDLPVNGNVTVRVFNPAGIEVSCPVNKHQNAGSYSFSYYPENLSSGIYFYKITLITDNTSEKFSAVKKMLFAK